MNPWAFAAIAGPFVLTPGASTALIVRNSIATGTRGGVYTTLGVNISNATWGVLMSIGMVALLRQWPEAWLAIRFGGAAYLTWLGARALRHAWTGTFPALNQNGGGGERRAPAAYMVEGFITNMLNPGLATFYLLIVPQFLPRSGPILRTGLLLTLMHVSFALTVHLSWSVASGTLSAVLGRRGPRRVLESIIGVAMLLLAIKAAVSS